MRKNGKEWVHCISDMYEETKGPGIEKVHSIPGMSYEETKGSGDGIDLLYPRHL